MRETCPCSDGSSKALERHRTRGGAGTGRAGIRHGVHLSAVLWALAATVAHAQTGGGPRPHGNACVEDTRPLQYGFYADFRPVSFSDNLDPDGPAINRHRGYEADLLTALETMADAGLAFSRTGIRTWPDIWLRPADPDYDFVGGGIAILDSRTRDADGVKQVTFTSGHIAFRQSLLVRAEDARRYASYASLDDARVAVLGGTTGEHRLLVLTGLAGAEGNLTAGATISLADGTTLTSDGSDDYRITAAGATGNLADRVRIEGPVGTIRAVLIMSTDQAQMDALADGRVDAVAGGEPGNREASRHTDSRFVVTALDPSAEYGGFAFDKDDQGLVECIDARINYLTDDRRIGFTEWLEDPQAFLKRARFWNATETFVQIYAYATLAELLRERFDHSWRALAATGDGWVDEGPVGHWLRVQHGERRSENARAASRPFDGGRWQEHRSKLEFGLYRPLDKLGSEFRAGISGHVDTLDAAVQNGRSTARSNVGAIRYGGAAHLTWIGKRGIYALTTARLSLWEAVVDYRQRELSTDVDGSSWGVSAEVGRRLGRDGFRMAPRLRVAWTGVDFDRFTDSDGVAVRQAHDRALEAALGLEFGVAAPALGGRLYGDLELAHDLEEDSAVNAYGYRFQSGLADSWVRLQVGAVREFSPRLSATLHGDFGAGLDSDTGKTSTWSMQAGVRWAL